ncbi:MAG: hypothetical protein MUF87_02665 [Anaerolineae bacterium]|nr:hypothetical protein [Anaerolineae bacterium]
MTVKRFTLLLVMMALLVSAVGVVSAQPGRPGGDGDGRGGRGGHHHGRMERMERIAGVALVRLVAEETGLTLPQVMEQVRDGSTLAEVITANGGNVDDVKAQAIEQATEWINDQVDNGRITQERADELIADLDTRITEALNFDRQQAQLERLVVMEVAGETGLTMREIVEELRAGKTLTQILTENGEDVQAFTDQTIAQAERRLNDLVANSMITQAEADERLATIREQLPMILEQTFDLPEAPMGRHQGPGM